MRIASIMTLGFLLPFSTGYEYYLLQDAPRLSLTPAKSTQEYILHLDLLQRLSHSVRYYNAHEHPEHDCVTDDDWELAWDTFQKEGLQPWLESRPFSSLDQVDLLHIFAMVIAPQPGLNHITEASSLGILQLITRSLLLPSLFDNSTSVGPLAPLLYGAVPHLRASLRSFLVTAQSPYDAHVAWQALISITCHIRHPALVLKDWESLMHHLVDDRAVYRGHDAMACVQRRKQGYDTWPRRIPFCAHAARGQLLATFVTCMNSMDSTDNVNFLMQAFTSLTDAIEWQLDCWKEPDKDDLDDADDKGQKAQTLHSPCLLASLLYVTRIVFPMLRVAVMKSEAFVSLMDASINSLFHADAGIQAEAASLLATVFSCRGRYVSEDHVRLLYIALKRTLMQLQRPVSEIHHMLCVASFYSRSFAMSLANYLLEQKKNMAFSTRYMAMIAANCPVVAHKLQDSFTRILVNETDTHSKLHMIACLVSSRQAYFFNANDDSTDVLMVDTVQQAGTWDQYKMACHCMTCGRFDIATKLLDHVQSYFLSEKTYLWIAALHDIAKAEAALVTKAAMGIPSAVTLLLSAVSYLETLSKSSRACQSQYTFQIQFLRLQLDFLDSLTVLRQCVSEMRIIAEGPAKNTRSYYILQSTLQSIETLASRYVQLNQQCGISFRYGQSSARLLTLQGAALLLALTAKRVFADCLPPVKEPLILDLSFILKHLHNPLSTMLQKFDGLFLHSLSASSMSAVGRAASLLEWIDVVLSVPIPFPRDLLTPHRVDPVVLALSSDTSRNASWDTNGGEKMGWIDAYPLIAIPLSIHGCLPRSCMTFQHSAAIRGVSINLSISYCGPVVESEDGAAAAAEDAVENEPTPVVAVDPVIPHLPDWSSILPIRARLAPGTGRFAASVELPPIAEEGMFQMDCQLHVMRVDGTEWQVPMEPSTASIHIRVSRSRD
jgi:hypothetical protein